MAGLDTHDGSNVHNLHARNIQNFAPKLEPFHSVSLAAVGKVDGSFSGFFRGRLGIRSIYQWSSRGVFFWAFPRTLNSKPSTLEL